MTEGGLKHGIAQPTLGQRRYFQLCMCQDSWNLATQFDNTLLLGDQNFELCDPHCVILIVGAFVIGLSQISQRGKTLLDMCDIFLFF